MKRKSITIKNCDYCPFRGGIGGSACRLVLPEHGKEGLDVHDTNGCSRPYEPEEDLDGDWIPEQCPLRAFDGVTVFVLPPERNPPCPQP